MNSKVYDRLKFTAQVLLPAIGALYFGLAGIWGLPKAEEVVGTISIVDVFLGIFLTRQSAVYSKSDARFGGEVTVLHDEGQVMVRLDDDAVVNNDEVTLRVAK